MNKLDKEVMVKNFPKVEVGKNGRYHRDDILKVLTFMKDHPNIQIKAIEEFSKISLGTLVSWRKKFGKYLGIQIKIYTDHGDIKTAQTTAFEAKEGKEKIGLIPISQISLSLIQELKKMHDEGSTAEFTINEIVFKVDDHHLYVLKKTNIKEGA